MPRERFSVLEERSDPRRHRSGLAVRSAYDLLELDLNVTAEQALAECQRRGLVISSHRELAGRAGSSHWHLRIPGQAGTIELNQWQSRVWVKVHPLRQGAWATDLARDLAELVTPAGRPL